MNELTQEANGRKQEIRNLFMEEKSLFGMKKLEMADNEDEEVEVKPIEQIEVERISDGEEELGKSAQSDNSSKRAI